MANVYSVGQVNTYIKNIFSQDYMLRSISVKGEVSNVKYHSSGHIYFTMKDQTATLQCVMFASSRKGLAFVMEEGMQIVATGSVEVYERDGKYQLYARKIVQDGAGDLYVRLEQLKKELQEMGMFDKSYKKPIPRYAKKIGIVTAPTGAAVQDIINIATRRNPYVQLILYPATVQGDGAAESIVRGIEALEAYGVDVIIAGRGGGSIEDLWAFNEEIVAKAIFACSVPVVSAVGHETDTTISDYVADLRAPTPSAAAELTVFDYEEFEQTILGLRDQLTQQITHTLRLDQEKRKNLELRLRSAGPEAKIREQKMHYVNLIDRIEAVMKEKILQNRHRLDTQIKQLESLSPLFRLQGGYVYASSAGKPLVKTEQVQKGDEIRLRLLDGEIHTKVSKIVPDNAERKKK
ncbi:MAG: exodeoxyribonuclease VII large subunit [Lachnospiraceae bacterium]|nr:exodeoxyribonuclease VII large subunit [Lachnospiraceae bacterium]